MRSAVTERSCSSATMEASYRCSPAVVCDGHSELSLTRMTTSESSNITPTGQSSTSNSLIMGSHSSDEVGNRTNSSIEIRTTSGGESSTVASCTGTLILTDKTSSAGSSEKQTPKGNETPKGNLTVTSSSSGHSSNASTERILKYLIQYVPETPKRKKECKESDGSKGTDKHRRLGHTEGERGEETDEGTRNRATKEGKRK